MLVYRAVKSWFGGAVRHQDHVNGHDSNQVDDVMIKDPVCGAYFPMRKAITLNQDDRAMHFCSTDCRDRFLNKNKTAG